MEDVKNQSVVYVGVDNALAGLIYFEDQIREDAGCVIESLTRQGINIYMLSGDKRSTAEYVGSVVGIPKEKVWDIQLSFSLQCVDYPLISQLRCPHIPQPSYGHVGSSVVAIYG